MGKLKCLDTYAIIEIFNENEKFGFLLDKEFVVTDFTLAEFYLWVYKKFNIETAEYWYKHYERYAVRCERDVLKRAVIFRYENRKNNISIYDAIGYIYSLENNCDFVTGDKEFEGLKGVEFVKK